MQTIPQSALVIVDVQYDFMPGGPLECVEADDIIAPLNLLLAKRQFTKVVITQDWHPHHHISFASRHPGAEPFDFIEVNGLQQVVWPDHCIQGSPGAEMHRDVNWPTIDLKVRLGTDPQIDAYSAFRDLPSKDERCHSTGLANWLRSHNITDVYLCGLTRDVSLLWSAEDAVELGFRTHFLWDITRPITFESDPAVRQRLTELGVIIHEQPVTVENGHWTLPPLKLLASDQTG
ncbi:nicotinamidase [Carnimonas bestiolae]|uniref:nicotinamidase n=1 Tax=Carnimonas bestiolae TaxID=3402172 RepID=UPI003EDC4195